MAANLPQARLFFALVPDDDLRHDLAELALVVAERVHGRALTQAQIHLTLAFLGNVPRARLDVACDAAAGIRSPAFVLRLETLGQFRKSDVTWIAPSGEAREIGELAGVLAARLIERGFALEHRAFHPHVTLTRRSGGPPPKLAVAAFDWHVTRYVLMESTQARDGVRYAEIAEWPLW